MYLGNGRLLTSFGILVYSAYSLDKLSLHPGISHTGYSQEPKYRL